MSAGAPAEIFRQYDVRGRVGEQLTPELVRSLARSYAALLADRSSPRVAVGRDNRPSSPELADAAAAGLAEAGVEAVEVGTVPTPVLYFAERELEADGGLQITGSHNPPEYNGVKLTLDGASLHGEAITGLRQRILAGDLPAGSGRRSEVDVLDRYVEAVAESAPVEGDVRLTLDCGNGTGSVIAVRALEAAGVDVDPLYCESDGTFPNHHPDPTVDAYIADLKERVRRRGRGFGVGLDGDADRIGAVDEDGGTIRGDRLLLLLALDVLERHPGAPVVFDVKCSMALPEMIREAGGEPVMWKTGHSLIKEKMRRTGAPVAGEMSGHICFSDNWFGVDDAIYDAARLAALVGRSGTTLRALAERIPDYPSTPELRLDCPEERKFALVDEVAEHYRGRHPLVDIDGARVDFGEGWALVRASNTQPVVVVRVEARTREALERIRDDVAGVLEPLGVNVPELSEMEVSG